MRIRKKRFIYFFNILRYNGYGDIMQRYFVEKKFDNQFTLSKDDSYHVLKVMRMNIGDKIEIVSNEKVYISEITCLSPLVRAKIVEECTEDSELPISVTIAQSLVKEQKMDFILQKATELGASLFIPLTTERSIVRMNGKENKKIDRWQKIVKEASEQSKRAEIPKVLEGMDISKLASIEGYDVKLLCTVRENTKNVKKLLSNIREGAKIIVVIGPEGGFTEEEEEKLIRGGFETVSLGKSILRTETASLFIMSVVRYLSMG